MAQLLQNALYGTALILSAAILRRLLKGRLIPEARLCLWAACLFRLLTPAAPESVLSLWGLPRLLAPQPQPAPPVPVPQAYIPTAPAPAPQPDPGIPWETVLAVAWLAVGAALAARYALGWARTRQAVACAIPVERADPRYKRLPACARLREGPMEGAPLTFGAVRPTVVLSPGLDGPELDCVLAHEGVHASRRDNLWHYAMALALAVHWWNPAVWLMARLLRRDIELSCDRAALKKLGGDRRADYAQALVSLATQGPDPDFCQTFGRKAAEERILSIMKFKKTSIIGVIFSLALVLAVTAAFASEPKEPDDTIVFHGQTFNRAGLSQETLDWLDGYLALTEEEQLAISYVPSELRKDWDASTQDAYDSVKAHTYVEQDYPSHVDPDSVDLSMMKELLAQKVAGGEITQEEADQWLASLEKILEQARRGELELFFMGTDANGCEFLYGSGSGAIYYKDGDGNLVPMDPGKTASSYVTEFPVYVEDSESIAEADRRLLGEGVVIYDGDIEHPVIYKNGYSVSADGGIIGQKFYDYNFVADGSAASGSMVRTISGTYVLCTAKDCDVPYSHIHLDRVYQEYPGPLCTLPDCANDEPHEHDGVQYAGKAPAAYTVLDPDLEPAPSDAVPAPTPAGQPTAGGLMHLVPSEATGWKDGYIPSGLLCHPSYPGTVTNPDEAVKYMEWLSTQPDTLTQPLYDADWNIIGEYRSVNRSASSSSSASYPVCIADGCALTGLHEHDGMTYCGGAGHHGNTCDGSCIYCAQQAAANGTYSTSGHHGNGHH